MGWGGGSSGVEEGLRGCDGGMTAGELMRDDVERGRVLGWAMGWRGSEEFASASSAIFCNLAGKSSEQLGGRRRQSVDQ